jgi:hypothetical protein
MWLTGLHQKFKSTHCVVQCVNTHQLSFHIHGQNIDCKYLLRVMTVFHCIFGQQNLAGPLQVLNKEIQNKANLSIKSGLPVVGWVVLSLAISRLMETRLSEENESTNLQPLDHSFHHILHLQCGERKT